MWRHRSRLDGAAARCRGGCWPGIFDAAVLNMLAAWDLAEPLLAADTADAWYLLVLVCANVGHTARLAELLPKAMAKAATTNFLAPHSRQRLNALADQTSSNRQA